MKNIIKIGILVLAILLVFILVRFSSGAPLQYVGINFGKPIHLAFVGDIMLSRQIGKIIDAHDPTYPFILVEPYIKRADIAFGNLENPVSTKGLSQGSVYSFRAKPETLEGLKFAGFDVMSIANNHMFDWGGEAFTDTMDHLSSESIEFVGGAKKIEETKIPVVFQKAGEKICYLAYTEFASQGTPRGVQGMAFLNTRSVVSDIDSANNHGCSIIVISLHWGNEYEVQASPEQKKVAQAFIDAGAKVVIGHHPHVLQEIEKYKDGLIAYSLGNFVFDQNFSEDTRKSAILNVYIKDGKITSFETVPIRFTKDFQPELVDAI